MPMITANGLQFMIERVGEGPNLLFIGGTGWDLRNHPNPLDSVLKAHFDITLYDQRGMGRSDKNILDCQMQDFAEDAIDIMNAIEWKSAHVVGYSFGGMVAQELAIRVPERVNSLVLAATAPGGEGGSSYPVERFLEFAPYERAKRSLEISDKTFTQQWQRQNVDEAESRITKRMLAQNRFLHEKGARHGLVQQLKARAQHNAYDRLDKITARTLILAGDKDGQVPYSAQENMQKKIANSQLKTVQGSHNFIFENDQAYQEIIKFFM